MPTGLTWQIPPATAWEALAGDYRSRIERDIVAIANHYAPLIATWMKENHAWQNRTGNAEAGLHTEVNHLAGQMVEIVLAHGDDINYGLWLEVRFAGKFAVIAPALDYFAPQVWRSVVGMLS